MKTAIVVLAGGTAIVAAVGGWELRSHWLSKTLRILPAAEDKPAVEDERFAVRLPSACGEYRRVCVTGSGRQQIYAKRKELISLFLPGSTAADIASAPGWSCQPGLDESIFYTLIGQNDHCAVAIIDENQQVVLTSRVKTGRLIEFAEKLKQAIRETR